MNHQWLEKFESCQTKEPFVRFWEPHGRPNVRPCQTFWTFQNSFGRRVKPKKRPDKSITSHCSNREANSIAPARRRIKMTRERTQGVLSPLPRSIGEQRRQKEFGCLRPSTPLQLALHHGDAELCVELKTLLNEVKCLHLCTHVISTDWQAVCL